MIPVAYPNTAFVDEPRSPSSVTNVRKPARASLRVGICLVTAFAVLAGSPAQAQVDADGSFGRLSVPLRAYVRQHLLRHVRDPKHARLRDVHIVRDVFGWKGAWALCGKIAVRGVSGQRLSYEPFLIAPQGDDPSPIVRNPVAAGPAQRNGSRREVAQACAEAAGISPATAGDVRRATTGDHTP